MASKKYSKLDKYKDYDKAAAEEMAEMMTEMIQLKSRLNVLNGLLDDNEELRPFVWTTAQGKSIAIHDLADDHLENILTHINNGLGEIPGAIRAEAVRRGIDIPENRRELALEAYSSSEAFNEDIDPGF